MTQKIATHLRSTAWLAERLGVSVTTVEKLRAAKSADLPPCLQIGRSIRYDELMVEEWLHARIYQTTQTTAEVNHESV